MAGKDSEAVAEAREKLSKAVSEFVRVTAEARGYTDAFTVAWSGVAEYVNPELQIGEQSGTVIMVPDDQHASTSRGLYGFGVDAFNRGTFSG